MICTICGSEMKNNGDWFACPTCGSVHFGPDPDEKKDAEKPPVKKAEPVSKIKEEPVKEAEPAFNFEKEFTKKAEPVSKIKEEPEKKAEPAFNFEKEFAKKAEPPVIRQEKPVAKEEARVKFPETPVEKQKHIPESKENAVENTTEPAEKEAAAKDEARFRTQEFSKPPVKPSTFTSDKAEPINDFSSFFNKTSEFPVEELPDQQESDEENQEDGKEKEKKKHTLKDIVDFMIPIVAAVVIAFVLKTFIIANAKVPTGSMVATINIDDRIIASRLAYKSELPQRYDIVLFYYPDNENDIFVKRVLGLPGETLEVIDGIVYITTHSGKTIQTDQSFVNPAETPSGNAGPFYIPEKGEIITVEGNYCFAENGTVLGHSDLVDKYCEKDERGNYVIAENLYFMMGDNRNRSLDSRSWDFPFVAEDKIIGKVLFKYYPSFEKIE